MIRLTTSAAKKYDAMLLNKRVYVVFGAMNKPKIIELTFSDTNFMHLTGLVYHSVDEKKAERFYSQAVNGKLKESDIDIKDHTTIEKLYVLNATVNLKSNAKMIGAFDETKHIFLKTDKLIGGIHSCMGFEKQKNTNVYFPKTVLNADIREKVYSYDTVLAIISTDKYKKSPMFIDYVCKDTKIDRLLDTIHNSSYQGGINQADMFIRYGTLVKYYGNEEQPVIPESVKTIGDRAFMENTSIKHIEIPDTVERIGKQAFEGCTNLKFASIPEGCDCDITAFPRSCNVQRKNYGGLNNTLKYD